MSDDFQLVMLSAFFENGGNTFHRRLDGHPNLYVYPFESQLGNEITEDYLSSLFRFKYRWPQFDASGDPEEDYDLFFDEELKTRVRRPKRSKFRDADFEFDEDLRRQRFVEIMEEGERSGARIVEAFFRSTFEAWKNHDPPTADDLYHVGYSPTIVIDTPRILTDFEDGHLVHVVRNPYSGYSETQSRPFPWSLDRYVHLWNIVQQDALRYERLFPDRVTIVRYEDLIRDDRKVMARVSDDLGIPFSERMLEHTWNGDRLENITPWGAIAEATPEENKRRRDELSDDEIQRIRSHSQTTLKALGYDQ